MRGDSKNERNTLRTSRSLSRARSGLRSNHRKREPVPLAELQQVIRIQREAPLADALRRALEIGKIVARHFLVRANQQVRELPAGGSRLREQLRNGGLQNVFREQECGFERHALRATATRLGALRAHVGVLIEKPARVPLENRGEKLQQLGRGHAFAALDHAEVRNRGRKLRVALDAARGDFFERESVALAQCAQLRAEEMAFAKDRGHERHRS